MELIFNPLGRFLISEFQKGNISFFIDIDLKDSTLSTIFINFIKTYTKYESIDSLAYDFYLSIQNNYIFNYETNFTIIDFNDYDDYNSCYMLNFSILLKNTM